MRRPSLPVVVAAFVLGCVLTVAIAVTDAYSEPRDNRGQCFDLMELHAGTAEVTRQHWFNHLDARGYARYWIACVEQWGTTEWECLDQLWREESNWYQLADGPGSTWGIPQAYPGDKMASHGPDWRTNPRVQVRWGTDYVRDRYGVPTNTPRHCSAGY